MAEQDNNPIGPDPQFIYHDRKLDLDGLWITTKKVEYADSSIAAIAASESVSTGIWTFYESDPLASDLLSWRYQHQRVVPGAYIYSEEFDPDLGPIGVSRRLVEDTGQVASQTATVNTTYESRSPSALVFWEVIKTNSDGTGSGGNPTFPIHNERIYDVQRGNISRSKQIVIKTGSEVATEVPSGGPPATLVTKTYYEPYEPNSLLLFKVIDTFTLPGPFRIGSDMNELCQGNIASIGVQLLAYNAAQPTLDVGYLEYRDAPVDAATKERTIVYAEFGFPTLTEIHYQMEKNGRKITVTFQMVDASIAPGSPSPGYKQEAFKVPNNKYRRLMVTTTWDAPESYTEYIRTAYSFPNLFDVAGFYSWSDACGALGNMVSERKVMTHFIAVHEWFSSLPGEQSYLVLNPITHMAGRGWQAFLETINDEAIYTYAGSCTAAFTFIASNPDLGTYNGLIGGSPQTMTDQCELDEDGRIHRITYQLVMR